MLTVLGLVVLVAAPSPNVVDGGLGREEVVEVLAAHQPEVAACLPKARAGAGVRYHFEVDSDGRPGDLHLLEVRGIEPAQVTCVGGALMRWRFPATGDAGTEVNWLFTGRATAAGSPPGAAIALPVDALAPLDPLAQACADQAEDPTNGRVSVELDVGRTGVVLASQVTTTTGDIAQTGVPACLAEAAWRLRLGPGAKRRRALARWAVANTDREVKLLFLPDEPAREVVVSQTRATTPGGLEREVIHEEILRVQAHVRFCYEQLISVHQVEGKVQFAWRIGPDGLVEEAEVQEDEIGVKSLNACIRDVVLRMKFPPPRGGGTVNVTFPWIFKMAGT